MDNLAARIAQFENMAQADPSNEMAHFSLGKAYSDAGRFSDAADSFIRCTQLIPDMSKAWQLAGEMLIKAGQVDRAADMLTEGYHVAARKGDFMPKTAIAGLLKQIGRPVPESSVPETAAQAMPEGMMVCARTGQPGSRMPRPPFKGSVGAWIQEHITAETWRTWIGQGTKVINELRLDLSRDQDAAVYDQHMREFLGIDETTLGVQSPRS